jgi:hypothetical protein
MEPITVAVVGDDPHALRVLAKLHELDPSKIIVVGAAPVNYARPFESSPFCTDLVDNMYPHKAGFLNITPQEDISFVHERMLKLLRRGGVTIKTPSTDDSPQRG